MTPCLPVPHRAPGTGKRDRARVPHPFRGARGTPIIPNTPNLPTVPGTVFREKGSP